MFNDADVTRTVKKVNELRSVYEQYLFESVSEPMAGMCMRREFSSTPPRADEYAPVSVGTEWGEEYHCGWFGFDFIVPAELDGKDVYVYSLSGAVEQLVYVNGKPVGASDYVVDGERPFFRLHKYVLVRADAVAGERIRIDIEGYASHTIEFLNPYDKTVTFATVAHNPVRVYGGIFVGAVREDIRDLLINLHFLDSLYAGASGYVKAEAENIYIEVFSVLSRMPDEISFDKVMDGVRAANAVMKKRFRTKTSHEDKRRVSLIGHSHMDTVWLWDTDETKRKLARTVCIMLGMMDRHPDYTFIMSSTLHLEWLKDNYPTLFERLKYYEREGRFEANGGSYVECDANLTGGEAMIRHFLVGQKFMKDNFGHYADCYWLPDTFGYSAAIPQILKGCRINGFLTTKINANDTNRFPYDTFYWKGIDGSSVLTQFNILQVYPDVATINQRADYVTPKRADVPTIISYGFGDGGGGPGETMVRLAEMSGDSAYTYECGHSTVSEHMKQVALCDGIPTYRGELYFELHRGTFTAKSLIKRYNRKLEQALRYTEIYTSLVGADYKRAIDEAYKLLLVNQFHDILPGTSIASVNENVYRRYDEALKILDDIRRECMAEGGLLFNPHGYRVTGNVFLPGDDGVTDVTGRTVRLVGFDIPALSTGVATEVRATGLRADGAKISTPYYEIRLREDGPVASVYDVTAGRELVGNGGLFNRLVCYEDVPYCSDNWDIDSDYVLKGEKIDAFSTEITVTDHVRIRSKYKVAERSELVQDMILYADSPRIDFESKLDWHDKHRLVKSLFDFNLNVSHYKSEIQFGHLERNISPNTTIEQAKFEVCNHTWTDISETSYGITFMNDSKYGVSVSDGSFGITLQKSGTHPDRTGDEGVHYFKYAVLPHKGYFSADNTVKPAHLFNSPPITCAREVRPFVEVLTPNVILETIKQAEDGDGLILRLYECEGTGTTMRLRFDRNVELLECNMLEEGNNPVTVSEYAAEIRAFEVKTIRIRR